MHIFVTFFFKKKDVVLRQQSQDLNLLYTCQKYLSRVIK